MPKVNSIEEENVPTKMLVGGYCYFIFSTLKALVEIKHVSKFHNAIMGHVSNGTYRHKNKGVLPSVHPFIYRYEWVWLFPVCIY